MSTVLQIISRSLRLIAVIDARTTPAAEESADALVALNAMVTRWEANGLALGWANADSTNDTLAAPLEAEDAIAFNLALKLAPEYGVTPSPRVEMDARESLAALRRDRLVAAPLTIASDLPSSHGYWNITTDEPA
jgi:hypothetical protein